MTICQRVAARLDELKMTRKQLADAAGVAPSTLHTWLFRGEDFPSSYIEVFAKAMDCSVSWLVTGEEVPATVIPDDYVQLNDQERFIINALRTLDFEGSIVVQNKAIEEMRRVKAMQGSSSGAPGVAAEKGA